MTQGGELSLLGFDFSSISDIYFTMESLFCLCFEKYFQVVFLLQLEYCTFSNGYVTYGLAKLQKWMVNGTGDIAKIPILLGQMLHWLNSMLLGPRCV